MKNQNDEILYRICSSSFVAGVIVLDNIIVRTAPILKKFKGQPISNLYKWAMNNSMNFERL